jgi:hypothetical protein
MWWLQIAVGLGLVALGIWARGRGRVDAGSSLWGIPILLGLVSLSVSAVQRVLPEWEDAALLGAFVAIGVLVVYLGARTWQGRH